MNQVDAALSALHAAHSLMAPGGARELVEDAIRALGGEVR